MSGEEQKGIVGIVSSRVCVFSAFPAVRVLNQLLQDAFVDSMRWVMESHVD